MGHVTQRVPVIVRGGTATTLRVRYPLEVRALECIIVCGMPSMMGRSVYSARVVIQYGSFDCCAPATAQHLFHPAFVRWEDR